MIVKIHKSYGKVVLAMCDDDILGKVFEDEDSILDLSSSFFKGEEMDEDVVLNLVKEAHIINAVGKFCVDFLINNNIVQKKDIKKINNTPHVQVLLK